MQNVTNVDNNAIVCLINQNLRKFDWITNTTLDDVLPVVYVILDDLQREVLPNLREVSPGKHFDFNFKIPHATFMQAIERYEKRTGHQLVNSDWRTSERAVSHLFTFALSSVFNLDENKLSENLHNRMMTSADGREYSYTASLDVLDIPIALDRLRSVYISTIDILRKEAQYESLHKNIEYVKTRTGLLHDLANENQAVNSDISRTVGQTLDIVEVGFKSLRKLIKRINNTVVGKLTK